MRVDAAAVILGGFGLGNFGDDLLMLATITAVRRVYDENEIAVLVYQGGERYCRRLNPQVSYVARRPKTRIESEVLIYGGGTQFYHFGGAPLKRGSVERAGRFLTALRQGRMSLRHLWTRGKPVLEIDPGVVQAAVSLGLGPFDDARAEPPVRELLAGLEFLSVRDEQSMQYCQEWGLRQAIQRSDFGFARSLWSRSAEATAKRSAGRQIGFVVRDWYRTAQGHRHLSGSLQLAAALQQRAYDVKFFLFDGQSDTTCQTALRRERLPFEVWDPLTSRVESQLEKLAACDLLVTSRAHGAIVGAVLGVPSICVEIEPKLRIMADSLGEAAALWSFPFDVNEGLSLVEAMSRSLAERSQAAIRISQEHGRSAERSADELADFLASCRASKRNR